MKKFMLFMKIIGLDFLTAVLIVLCTRAYVVTSDVTARDQYPSVRPGADRPRPCMAIVST